MMLSPTKDLLIVLVIVLLIFGPKRLPGLGRQLGQGIREFKDSITGHDDDADAEPPQLAQSTAVPAATVPPAAVPTAAGAPTVVEQRQPEPTPVERRA